MSDLLSAALRYAEHAWPVFPCRVRDKTPATPDGFKSSTTNPEQVRTWWTENPRYNIGFVPGRAGLIVIDVDGMDGEREAQARGLYSEPTLTVATSRGWHLYFKHPGGHIGNRQIVRGLDVRADAGYVLLSPSEHPSGAIYKVVTKVQPIALPFTLAPDPAREIRTPSPVPIDAGTRRRRAYVAAAIERECVDLASTGEGGRNIALNRAAFSLARFVETGEADPVKLIEVLTIAAEHAGLDPHEIEKTISSAFGARGVAI